MNESNVYSFPKIKEETNVSRKVEEDEEKFQVLETTLSMAIKINNILTPIVRNLFVTVLEFFKILFKVSKFFLITLERMVLISVTSLVEFLDYLSCVISKKTHGA